MSIASEIQEYKEKLYLASLKVAHQTMNEALEDEEFISSGILSASASLLKLSVEDVVKSENSNDDLSSGLRDLIKNKEVENTKLKSPHYKDAGDD